MVAVWVLWALIAVVASGRVVSRLTAAAAARGVPVSARLEQARRIAEAPARRPCAHPPEQPRSQARRHQPHLYVAHCHGGAALGLRHSPSS
jgi:hypothetical protein